MRADILLAPLPAQPSPNIKHGVRTDGVLGSRPLLGFTYPLSFSYRIISSHLVPPDFTGYRGLTNTKTLIDLCMANLLTKQQGNQVSYALSELRVLPVIRSSVVERTE